MSLVLGTAAPILIAPQCRACRAVASPARQDFKGQRVLHNVDFSHCDWSRLQGHVARPHLPHMPPRVVKPKGRCIHLDARKCLREAGSLPAAEVDLIAVVFCCSRGRRLDNPRKPGVSPFYLHAGSRPEGDLLISAELDVRGRLDNNDGFCFCTLGASTSHDRGVWSGARLRGAVPAPDKR